MTAAERAADSMTTLSFAGDGDTFLAHIEATVQQRGTVLAHRYLTVTADDGALWQGEELRFADETLVFLQAAGHGGTAGVQLVAAADVTDAALTTLPLPTVAVAPQQSTAPLVSFVRARLVEPGAAVNRWTFDVTISYPDTGWTDYADGWHIESPDGAILGTRVLLHPHVEEQPFTRSLSAVDIPTELTTVLIRSHDLIGGYSSDPVAIPLEAAAVTERYELIR